MKTFIGWAEDKKYDLASLLTDSDPSVPTAASQENATRTGQGPFYPPAYKRGQYVDGYFAPTKATWALDAENSKKSKITKGSGTTPL